MKGLKTILLLLSVLLLLLSCEPFENETEREPDPIDRLIGDYTLYASTYLSFYTVNESMVTNDTVDLRINKIASDAAELVSDVVNTVATINGTTLTLKTSTEIGTIDGINVIFEFSYRNINFASDVLQFTSDIQGEMSSSGKTLPLSGVMTIRAIKKKTTVNK